MTLALAKQPRPRMSSRYLPSSLNDHVVMSVDFDAIHGSAVFKGAAK